MTPIEIEIDKYGTPYFSDATGKAWDNAPRSDLATSSVKAVVVLWACFADLLLGRKTIRVCNMSVVFGKSGALENCMTHFHQAAKTL